MNPLLNPLASPEEIIAHRKETIQKLRHGIKNFYSDSNLDSLADDAYRHMTQRQLKTFIEIYKRRQLPNQYTLWYLFGLTEKMGKCDTWFQNVNGFVTPGDKRDAMRNAVIVLEKRVHEFYGYDEVLDCLCKEIKDIRLIDNELEIKNEK